MLRFRFLLILYVFIICSSTSAAQVKLLGRDAVVWHQEQFVTGELVNSDVEKVMIHHNDSTFYVEPSGNRFSFHVTLKEKENTVWAEVAYGDTAAFSDTLDYTLGYDPAPPIKPVAVISGGRAVLKAVPVDPSFSKPLKYIWKQDPGNPAYTRIVNSDKAVAAADIPEKDGNYFFNLYAVAGRDTTRFQTLVTRSRDGLHAFDMETDPPGWMENAVIYEITPYSFVKNGTFGDITVKLPELKKLGINTIWLQPVTKSSYRGQGYDVIDYLSVNPALGSGEQLRRLINTAKDLDMRVLFDVVLNHTSVQHLYAQDVIKNGPQSHYYSYYQMEEDAKPYSSFYNRNEEGFIHYFWDDLVNLNYNNKEVRRWMLEVCKYWVREYDIDGYRFDAIWGVNARRPSFAQRLRVELKSIKPDILLLAEDKGSNPGVFERGFDAAYDWTSDTTWVSQWSWEYEYSHEKNLTIFNHPDSSARGDMLRQAIFKNKENAYRLLRYMGNNDLPHFIQDHTFEQTKMTAALLFSLPGIPMLYNGQEIGLEGHPYAIESVFARNKSIRHSDNEDLFDYYRKLIHLRKQYPALKGKSLKEYIVSDDRNIVAFHRRKKEQDFVVILNMNAADHNVTVCLNNLLRNYPSSKKPQLRDVLSNDIFLTDDEDPGLIKLDINGYSARWLLLER